MLCGADVYIFSVCGFTARDLGDGRYVFAELAVRGKAEFLYGVARCFMVVTVAQTFLVVGTDTLDRRFMVCHL